MLLCHYVLSLHKLQKQSPFSKLPPASVSHCFHTYGACKVSFSYPAAQYQRATWSINIFIKFPISISKLLQNPTALITKSLLPTLGLHLYIVYSIWSCINIILCFNDGWSSLFSFKDSEGQQKSNKLNFVTQLKPNKIEKQLVTANKAISTSEYVNKSISLRGKTTSYRFFHNKNKHYSD